MQNPLRWIAILAVMLLAIAACTPAGESPSASAGGSTAEDPTAVCEADAKGCVEVAAGDPIRLASANTISGDTAFLGNDINFGIQVAFDDRGEVAGHPTELVKEDAGCGDAATGQTAAQAIVAQAVPTVPAVAGVIEPLLLTAPAVSVPTSAPLASTFTPPTVPEPPSVPPALTDMAVELFTVPVTISEPEIAVAPP